jgi:DNA-binding NarL/FixJ family response regulator
MKEKKRIVIAEDHRILREGLKALLSDSDDIQVVGEAEDGIEAVRAVEKHHPDLILLDLAMPRMDGISAIKEIKSRYPETKILALTIHESEEFILETFRASGKGRS